MIVVLGGVILAGTSDAGVAVGALLVAATCVCWGIDNAITASLDSYTPSQITLAKGVVAGSVNLTLGLFLHGAPAAQFALAALTIGAIGYGLHAHVHELKEHAHPIAIRPTRTTAQRPSRSWTGLTTDTTFSAMSTNTSPYITTIFG